MGSPSHIGPFFGNAPVTVQRPVTKVGMPPKTPIPAKPLTPSLFPAGWALRDYFYYGAAGVGTALAAKSGYTAFGPTIGKLLGSKPPPLPPPSLSPASQLYRTYEKITSALSSYLKPLIRGTAVIGGGGAVILGASALQKGEERAAVRGRTRSLSLTRHSSNLNAPRRTTRSLSPSSTSERGRSTQIQPLEPRITSAINAIRPSNATHTTRSSSPERGTGENNRQENATSSFSLRDLWRENNSRPNQRQADTSVASSSENSQLSIGADVPTITENTQPNVLKDFWVQSRSKPNQERALRQQQASISNGNASHSSNSSFVSSGSDNNFMRNFWKNLNQQPEVVSSEVASPQSVSSPNVTQQTEREIPESSSNTSASVKNSVAESSSDSVNTQATVENVNKANDSTSVSASESLESTSSLPQSQNLEHSALLSEQENQELLNHLPCPLTIPENSEPLLTSNHSLPTSSSSSKGKAKAVQRVETPPSNFLHHSRDSIKLPFSPEELSKRLQQTGRVEGESSSSASSSTSNSQASTGLINFKMDELWDGVDGITTPPSLVPVESPKDIRSPFIVSNPPSSTPSVYATPKRGRSRETSPPQTPFFTPSRGPSPVRKLENHEQFAQGNVEPSSQIKNNFIKSEKSKPLTSENLEDNSSITSPENHTQSGSSSSQADNTVESSSSTTIEKGKAPERNNPSENHDSELLNYKLSPSRNPENLRQIIEKGVSQEALTNTLHRICCDTSSFGSHFLASEIEMLLKVGAKVDGDELFRLLSHSKVDLKAIKLLVEAGADPRKTDSRGITTMEALLEWAPMIITKPEERFVPRKHNQIEHLELTKLLDLLETRANELDVQDAKRDCSWASQQSRMNRKKQYAQKRAEWELSNYIKLPMKDREPENLRRIITYAPDRETVTETLRRICDYRNGSHALSSEIGMLIKAGAEIDHELLQSLLSNNTVDLGAVKLLLEAGVDPRKPYYRDRSLSEIISQWKPSVRVDSNNAPPSRHARRQILRDLLSNYIDLHNALDKKDSQRLLFILNAHPDLKIPLAGNPTLTMTERLLFNPKNSERIAQIFGERTPAFLKNVLGLPLEFEKFSDWAINTLHPPLSYRLVNQPEIVSSLQHCLGKTQEETEQFIKKAIQKELSEEFQKVEVLDRFPKKKDDQKIQWKESERWRELAIDLEKKKGLSSFDAIEPAKTLLAGEMANRTANYTFWYMQLSQLEKALRQRYSNTQISQPVENLIDRLQKYSENQSFSVEDAVKKIASLNEKLREPGNENMTLEMLESQLQQNKLLPN